ncbi:uncharacterized protein LOC119859812 [Dermochelys coriacea]|uniref:uncharacterized protein LOC119859812 n=1 Tax=Dermochelys coriacea TaxID=27794 RepID=UPI0018E7C0C9|nr:uncharacterized protein LOC119859812 [Dermochelys coriacea]
MNLFPPPRLPTPQWDLNQVLKGLTRLQFESTATCALTCLSMKMVFLIAVTSARRVGEIAALMAPPPFTVLFPDKVMLRPHPKFTSKMSSAFHINQLIWLPAFYPKPHQDNREAILHTLDMRRALAFCLDRIRIFKKFPRRFHSIAGRSKEICRSATWAIVLTFAEHYAILGDSAADAKFGSIIHIRLNFKVPASSGGHCSGVTYSGAPTGTYSK